jgi:hypothetical protein
MTEHYVTLFDSGFLANGLALHTSMRRHAPDSVLWVLCTDDTSQRVLESLALPGLRTIALDDALTPALAAVRADRTRAEFSWTLAAFTPDLVFAREPSARWATYVDADMWLARSPSPILDELRSTNAGVMITEHAYAPEFEQSLAFGIYCVQFMPFERDASAHVRSWWQDRVVEWCYARAEDGKFGDQKYLDDWPERFGDAVHVLANPQWTQAPWNATRFDASDAITYHFHRLRTTGPDQALVGLYRLPRPTVDLLYRPYLADLRAAYTSMASVGFVPTPQSPPPASVVQRGKDWLAFRLHNRRSPLTPYRLPF